MNGIIIAIVGVLVVVGGVYTYSNNQKEDALAEQKAMMEKKQMVNDDLVVNQNNDTSEEKVMEADVAVEKKTEEVMEGGEIMKTGSYEAYSADKLARAETGDVVLFFHASWCPSCRGLNTSIEGNLKSIPEGVSILKLDYDKEVELKKKYGVTTQHTLVQVDANGNMIKKWSGGGDLGAVLAQIQ